MQLCLCVTVMHAFYRDNAPERPQVLHAGRPEVCVQSDLHVQAKASSKVGTTFRTVHGYIHVLPNVAQ